LISHFSLMGNASVYYISNSGKDSNTGLTTSQAWASLSKVNAYPFKPGDQILFQRGSTFYGSLTVKNSGTAGNPITFGAYGTGDKPVITGFTTVTAWTNIGGNIWESTNAVSTLQNCNMVVINGINTAMGRYPNAGAANGGYLTYQAHSGLTSITSSNLTGTLNWTGAEVVVRTSRWALKSSTIISQSTSTLNYLSLGEEPINGFGFFIQKDLRTLDSQNEWYYNSTTKKICIYSSLYPTNVQISANENLAYIQGNYITVENINFTGGNSRTIYVYNPIGTCHHNIIQYCHISFSGSYGIYIRGNFICADYNDIIESNTSAIETVYSKDIKIRYNNVKNTYLIQKGGYSPAAISANYYVTGIKVEYNRIINSGHNGMTISSHDSTAVISYNYIDTFNKITDDGGAIYIGGMNNLTGSQISSNIIINREGNWFGTSDSTSHASYGIYLDSGSGHCKISNNTVANCSSGIFIHDSSDNLVHNNTIYNCSSQLLLSDGYDARPIENNTITNNTLVSKSRIQPTLYVLSGVNNIGTFGTFDYNYYARPIDDNLTIKLSQPSTGLINKSLLQWQNFSTKDANSFKSPISIQNENDLRFDYNATKEPKIINIDVPMMDVTGAKYFGKLVLLPFTSVVLIKDSKTPIVTTEYQTICEGNIYNGWTTSGKYERKEISASGDYALVTTYLTVIPMKKVTESITINEGEEYQGWKQAGTYTRKLSSVGGCDSIVTTNLQVAINTTKQADMEYTQTIELLKGYNLISTYIAAPNADASEITKALREQNLLVKIQDETGNSLENWGSYGGWVNQLGAIENTEGYKIQVTDDCTLQVTGRSVSLPLDISLKAGWNIISFPRNDLVNSMNVVQPLIDQNLLLKVQDEAGNSIENWGMFGGWKNGIGNFAPGKAYKVLLKADALFTIQENYPKSAVILAQTEKTEYFTTRVVGNGTDHMNINIAGLSNAGIAIGDELAVFDGAICVGSIKITETILSSSSTSIIASYSTDDQNQNGFKVGDLIQIYVWNKLNGKKTKVNAEVINGQLNYEKNASVLVSLKSLSTGVTPIDDAIHIDVFPNPSNGRFTVRFSESPATNSVIDILDISGRKITSRLVTRLSEVFNLEEQAPGLYLVKTTIGSKDEVHKLIIN